MINWFQPFVEFFRGVVPGTWIPSFLGFCIVAALFVWLRGAIDV